MQLHVWRGPAARFLSGPTNLLQAQARITTYGQLSGCEPLSLPLEVHEPQAPPFPHRAASSTKWKHCTCTCTCTCNPATLDINTLGTPDYRSSRAQSRTHAQRLLELRPLQK
ncbi:hypothetical protein VTG60DRAFT_5476 [Thermothelomyces hinnuleus]